MTSDSESLLDDLLSKVLDGSLDAQEEKTLTELLLHDEAARRLYHDHIALHALLRWQEKDVDESASEPCVLDASFSEQARPMTLPLYHRVGDACRGAVTYFDAHHVALAYLITTVLFLAVIVAASHVYISDILRPARVASTASGPAASPKTAANESADAKQETQLAESMPTPKFVGRITAEAECRWQLVGSGRWAVGSKASGERKLPVREAEKTHQQGADAPRSPSLVCLGDRLVVASGLLEITFDTGAKVILEGPCRFNVEENGGFLAVGRLTGKMGKGGEGRGARGEGRKTSGMISNNRLAPASTPGAKVGGSQLAVDGAKPQAASNEFTSHQPLATSHSFVIATPTAIVTDLGTEFGVDVDEEGRTASHVFRGLVEIRPKTSDVQQASLIRLSENESAKVVFNAKHTPVVRRVMMRNTGFVREMPSVETSLILKDAFNTRQPSNKYGDGGLNQELSRRQSGLCRGTSYWCGGDFFSRSRDHIQVNNPLCPGMLALCADYGQAGWVALNCNFQRNVCVSADLMPVAVHWPDNAKPDVFTRDSVKNGNWIALAVRCAGLSPTPAVLPLSQDVGAAIVVRTTGRWEYFENGRRMAVGNVPVSSVYHVFLRTFGSRLEIRINELPLKLDADRPAAAHVLQGWAAETADNYIAIGVSNAVSLGGCNEASRFDPVGRDLSAVGNFVVSKAFRSAKPPEKAVAKMLPSRSDGQ